MIINAKTAIFLFEILMKQVKNNTAQSSSWFACDVRAAILVVKNKIISLLWELNSIFMLILREKILLH